MIIYLDTSSLVKLYVEEDYSDNVREWIEEAEIVATCRIAYPEAMSAFHRRFRSGDFLEDEYRSLTTKFSEEWDTFVAIDFDERQAGQLVEKYGLKGLDAVHLSSVKLLDAVEKTLVISFSSFDEKLNDSASAEGFAVLKPEK